MTTLRSHPGGGYLLEHSTDRLVRVHTANICAGRPCPIHNLTDHSMRGFPQHFRSDRGIMERICPHGVGHPDPDDVYSLERDSGVHGCDGCCAPPTHGECVPCGAPAGGRCRLEAPGECPDGCVKPEAW